MKQAIMHQPPELNTVKKHVTQRLQKYFDDRIVLAASMDPAYLALWESLQKVVLTGGKRYRPYMTALAYDAYKQDAELEAIIDAATGVELLHIALLIHDDVIDRDLVRHGIRNVTGQIFDSYQPYISDELERLHYANGAAILAGDLLIAAAHELVVATPAPKELIIQASQQLSLAIFEVAGGELVDTELAFRDTAGMSALDVALYKTASYSFCLPLRLGAMLGGADVAQLAILQSFGSAIGVAFQLKDDLLGVFGDTSVTGKSTTSDIREGKRTYLIEQFYSLASTTERDEFNTIFGITHANAERYERARQLLMSSGAKTAVEDKIADLRKMALEQLEMLTVPAMSKTALLHLVDKCTEREL